MDALSELLQSLVGKGGKRYARSGSNSIHTLIEA
jgi:hypothetical protein